MLNFDFKNPTRSFSIKTKQNADNPYIYCIPILFIAIRIVLVY